MCSAKDLRSLSAMTSGGNFPSCHHLLLSKEGSPHKILSLIFSDVDLSFSSFEFGGFENFYAKMFAAFLYLYGGFIR